MAGQFWQICVLLALAVTTATAVTSPPWLATVMAMNGDILRPVCSGALVSRGGVIAPASCFFNVATKAPLFPFYNLRVFVGQQNLPALTATSPSAAMIGSITYNPKWSGNESDIAVVLLKHCQSPASVAMLNQDSAADTMGKSVNVWATGSPVCNARDPMAVKTVPADILSQRNENCDKASEYKPSSVSPRVLCVLPKQAANSAFLCSELDIGAVAADPSGAVLGIYDTALTFARVQAHFEWIQATTVADVCPKLPVDTAPLPTSPPAEPSILSPIYVGANATDGNSLLREAQDKAIQILSEAQVKGRMVYLSAVQRASRGNPKGGRKGGKKTPANVPPSGVNAGGPAVTASGLPIMYPSGFNVMQVLPNNPDCPSAKCPPGWPKPPQPKPDYLETELPKSQSQLILWGKLGLHKKLRIDPKTLKGTRVFLKKLKDFHRKNVKRYEETCKGPICPVMV